MRVHCWLMFTLGPDRTLRPFLQNYFLARNVTHLLYCFVI